MKYLIMAVFGDGIETFTYSKVKGLASRKPKDCGAEIVKDICKSAKQDSEDLVELFVFQSAKKQEDAPKLVASWDLDDGLFGDTDDDDDFVTVDPDRAHRLADYDEQDDEEDEDEYEYEYDEEYDDEDDIDDDDLDEDDEDY